MGVVRRISRDWNALLTMTALRELAAYTGGESGVISSGCSGFQGLQRWRMKAWVEFSISDLGVAAGEIFRMANLLPKVFDLEAAALLTTGLYYSRPPRAL